ncbi:unnamed protein product [Cyprideis torosa]|uniref:Uncharacterized protein n=1 Tax=Cyprideis torosa TaxID=163714 RepID=A0A7R8WK69_9CRUS|nr:unnamed protein product [Cyprideis torosa]CAG0902805.1 unnamed protein product [Cyprideis torosa]
MGITPRNIHFVTSINRHDEVAPPEGHSSTKSAPHTSKSLHQHVWTPTRPMFNTNYETSKDTYTCGGVSGYLRYFLRTLDVAEEDILDGDSWGTIEIPELFIQITQSTFDRAGKPIHLAETSFARNETETDILFEYPELHQPGPASDDVQLLDFGTSWETPEVSQASQRFEKRIRFMTDFRKSTEHGPLQFGSEVQFSNLDVWS